MTEEILVSAGQTFAASAGLPEPARLSFRCEGEDHQGNPTGPLPCKVTLQAGHDASMNAPVALEFLTFGLTGSGEFVAPAGDWTATLSHGWEYTILRENVSLASGSTASVSGTLGRQVDTSGFVAADLHSHTTRSIDSWFVIEDKIASNVCEGVEILVVTDHDCQTDISSYVDQLSVDLYFDLQDWIRTVVGNEVSPLYAHMTVFPLPTHPTGWIYWQVPWTLYRDGRFARHLEYPELFAQVRELGAKIINVAHPLSGQGYFHYLGFDPPGSFPRLAELPPEKFSSAFDTIELLNGNDVEIMLAEVLPLWSNLNNQGLFRTATGTSDTHERDAEAGFGRTMVASSTDEPGDIDLDEIWTNLRERRAVVAAGTFVRIGIDEATVGELLTKSPPFDVHIQVEAADWVPASDLILLGNGEVVAELPLEGPGVIDAAQPAVRFDGPIQVSPSVDTWYAVLATGPTDKTMDPVFRGDRSAGLTNVIRVDVDGNGQFDPPIP